jgi:hypothetical protein
MPGVKPQGRRDMPGDPIVAIPAASRMYKKTPAVPKYPPYGPIPKKLAAARVGNMFYAELDALLMGPAGRDDGGRYVDGDFAEQEGKW